MKLTNRTSLVRSWQAGLQPSLFHCYTSRTLVTDVLGPLMAILTPDIRAAASHLLSSDEREFLEFKPEVRELGVRPRAARLLAAPSRPRRTSHQPPTGTTACHHRCACSCSTSCSFLRSSSRLAYP